jgi:hypothetical protein
MRNIVVPAKGFPQRKPISREERRERSKTLHVCKDHASSSPLSPMTAAFEAHNRTVRNRTESRIDEITRIGNRFNISDRGALRMEALRCQAIPKSVGSALKCKYLANDARTKSAKQMF